MRKIVTLFDDILSQVSTAGPGLSGEGRQKGNFGRTVEAVLGQTVEERTKRAAEFGLSVKESHTEVVRKKDKKSGRKEGEVQEGKEGEVSPR